MRKAIVQAQKPALTVKRVSSDKKDLVSIFRPVLWSERRDTSAKISLELVRGIIEHKSFGTAFTYEIWGKNIKMKPSHISHALDNLAKSIYDYLSSAPYSSQGDFDNWEKEIGEKFLSDCEAFSKFKFGKAQKIINVTMKHLYCYDVAEDYFRFCHVALDSMTYTGRSNNSVAGGFYKCEVKPGAKTKSFSNLTYPEYIEIQRDIREYLAKGGHDYIDCKSGNCLTPFKAEFYIWPRYKKLKDSKKEAKKKH